MPTSFASTTPAALSFASSGTEGATPIPDDAALVRAYREARWSVEFPTATAEFTLEGIPADPLLRPSGVVTAFNPASLARSLEENRAADLELLRHVRSLGVPFRRAVATGTGGWEEPGYLLLGDVRPILVELGLVFGQNAVVWIDEAGTPSLVCTRAGFAQRLPGQRIDH
jgi:hypothetical protein